MHSSFPGDPLPRLKLMCRRNNGDTAAKSMAACTLHAWMTHFTQPERGIGAPADMACHVTHFDADPRDPLRCETAYSPVFPWSKDSLHALLFSDQSVIVARREGDELIALPIVFSLYKERAYPNPVPVIRSRRKPIAQISFRRQKHETHLPSFSPDDPSLMDQPGAQDVFDALDSDLETLSPLFDSLPAVELPHGCLPGDNVHVPNFLPQRRFSDEDRLRATDWARDIADWFAVMHPDYTSISVHIATRPPMEHGRPHVLIGPYRLFHATANGTGGMHNIETHPGAPEHLDLPIPHDKLYSLEFVSRSMRFHRWQSGDLVDMRSSESLSRHRKLFLMNRFGHPRSSQANG